MSKLLLIISLIISHNIFALDVDMGDEDNPVVYGVETGGTSTFTLVTEGSSGDAIDNPYTTYIPFVSSSGSDSQGDYYYRDGIALGNKSSSTAGIRFDLSWDNDGTSSLDLWVAIRNDADEDFRIIKELGNSGDSSLVPVIYFDELCSSSITSTDLDSCTDLNSGSDVIEEIMLYIFLADGDAGYTINSEINPTNEADSSGGNIANGMYIKAFISTDISNYSNSTVLVSGLTLSRGDQTAYLKYTGDFGSSAYVDRLAVYTGTGTSDFYNIYDIQNEDGEVSIEDLTNGTSYNFTAVFVDKFGFVADAGGFPLDGTANGSVTPEEIETLLDENACYLVTAGFQRDHYILDYFRSFRDNYLLKNYFGQKFVEFYYSTAPKYASFIYNNPFISRVVRIISYFIYGIMKFGYIMIASFIGLYFLVRIRKRCQKEFLS